MKKIKETDIYPKFEFRLSKEDKAWLTNELKMLKSKFNDTEDEPAITKNVLLISALRHGIRYLKNREKICPSK